MKLLSTKKISVKARKTLESCGVSLTEYPAIAVSYPDISIPAGFKHFIFTSKNGVKAFIKLAAKQDIYTDKEGLQCFCVGAKTTGVLQKNGFNVVHTTPNAGELAQYISKKYEHAHFLYPCGNRRLKDLPAILELQGVALKELVVYETALNTVKLDGHFDGVLFFSPSAVESFFSVNSIGKAEAFCIGPTTARVAKEYTDHVKSADTPTEEELIQLVIRVLKPAGTH